MKLGSRIASAVSAAAAAAAAAAAVCGGGAVSQRLHSRLLLRRRCGVERVHLVGDLRWESTAKELVHLHLVKRRRARREVGRGRWGGGGGVCEERGEGCESAATVDARKVLGTRRENQPW